MLAAASLAQAAVVYALLRRQAGKRPRTALLWALAISWIIMAFGFALRGVRVGRVLHGEWATWTRAVIVFWTVLSIFWAGAFALMALSRKAFERWFPRTPGFQAARRGFLGALSTAFFAAPAAALGYGMFIERHEIGLREHNIPVTGLHKDLDGLRLVQITDIHRSSFFSRKELDYAIALANETRAHVALVTGDLITTVGDPLDDCLAGLKPLRADAGVFGCMGNHEVYANAENYVQQAAAHQGQQFLRGSTVLLPFGQALLNIAGVDYQRFHARYLEDAQGLVRPGAYNLLLSHNPDVFPVAVRKGFDLTLSGHTHGGQVRVEFLHSDVNVARFFTPYVDGLYTRGGASIFVSRGLGTIGIPARLGAPPEVTLLRLCRI